MRWLIVGLVALAAAGWHSAARADNRVALVVGNGAYRATTPLANPLNDARDMAAALKSAGFTVVEAFDAGKPAFDRALRTFADSLAAADVALFFYAGHGLQVGTQNYLVPVDAKLERERDLEFEAVRLDFVLRQMEIDREGRTSIVILDACRDNPLSRNLARSMGTRSTAIGKGLAAASTGLGTFIVYSTQPGNVALDGDGRNSPFTSALVRHMNVKGRNLPALMIEVRKDVVSATSGRQVPWDHSALTTDFYFSRDAGTASLPPSPGPSLDLAALQERLRQLEEEAKQRAVRAKEPQVDVALLQERVNRFEQEARQREQAAKRKSATLDLADMAGRWSGTYSYSSGTQQPVNFSMTLNVSSGTCAGRIEEPNTFGNPSSKFLYANITCALEQTAPLPTLVVNKTYDGTGGVNHSIVYRGSVAADGRLVTGTWRTGTLSGPFHLRRQDP